jgi:hypothetical protein
MDCDDWLTLRSKIVTHSNGRMPISIAHGDQLTNIRPKMTDNWDFYALRVDGEPASIFVDLGIQVSAPVASLSHMAYIRLYMNEPRADGLSSQEEFERLIEIEDAIGASLCSEEVGYVGRNTSGGCRDFYFYVSRPEDWQSRVDRLLSSFSNYKYEIGTREDPGWTTYLNFLLPSAADRQRIENRRVCEALERNGDKLVAKREIDHWSYFPNLASAEAYLTEIRQAGYQVRAMPERDEDTLHFSVQVWRIDVPSYDNINDVTLPLFEASARHGGEYDGWECPVET